MSYKIIASDLDGTLLDSNSEVSCENLKAIEKLANLGVFFVPSTGRTFNEIPEKIRNNENVRYYICANGSTVYDKKTGKSIKRCISNEVGKKVLGIVSEYEIHTSYRKDGSCYVDSRFQTDEAWEYYNVCLAHQVVVRNFSIHLDDFESSLATADEVEVYSFFFKNAEDQLECKARLRGISEIAVAEVTEYNIEVFNAEAGKGKALYALADMLGVDRKETMALGDSNNDASIILAAGLGLAMENACDSLKEIADDVICRNDEHVAEFVLKNYF